MAKIKTLNNNTPDPANPNDSSDHKDVSDYNKSGFSARHIRQVRLLRISILPVMFALIVIMAVIIFRNYATRNEIILGMETVGKQIEAFHKANNAWPSHIQFQTFNLKSRNISLSSITYEPEQILKNSPHDTVLAYSPMVDMLFMPPGHAVLYLDGQVKWVSDATLKTQLKKRLRFYNSNIVKYNTTP